MWRSQVKDALAARKDPDERTIEWLASQVGADPGGLRRLINKVGIPKGKKSQNTSSLKGPIDAVLGIDSLVPQNDEERLVIRAMRTWPDAKRRALMALLGGD